MYSRSATGLSDSSIMRLLTMLRRYQGSVVTARAMMAQVDELKADLGL